MIFRELSGEGINLVYIVNWNGDSIEASNLENIRTNKAGTFISADGVKTYFPLPMSFNTLVPIVGKYRVPSAHHNRADLIAKELYQDEELWWVIYWSNNIIDPFVGPVSGDIINIIDIIIFKKIFNK